MGIAATRSEKQFAQLPINKTSMFSGKDQKQKEGGPLLHSEIKRMETERLW
jgi:hypothetical protein